MTSHSVRNANRDHARETTQHEIDRIDDLIENGNLTPDQIAELESVRRDLIDAQNVVLQGKGKNKHMQQFDQAAAAADRIISGVEESVEAKAGELFGSADAYTYDVKGDPPSTTSTGDMRDIMTDGAALLHLQETDPAEFAAQFRDLESGDKQMAMMTLQQEIQSYSEINQMLTAALKARHDTAMAVARNMTV